MNEEPPMTIDELIEKLEAIDQMRGVDVIHAEADRLLVEFIGNDRVRELHVELAEYFA